MNLDNVFYNNVGEREKTALGYKLHRFPRDVEKHMNEHARWMSRFCCGCEIRFVTRAKNVEVTLVAEQGAPNITILRGDYVCSRIDLKPGEIRTIRMSEPAICNASIDRSFYQNNRFSPDVWRIWMHNGSFTVCSIDAYGEEVRPPRPDEMPEKTLLAYGSSITHGAGANFMYSCYANQLAVRMGADVQIKGTGGSCHCEKEVVDYLAAERWDYALLEPVINMCGGFEKEEIARRVEYLVKTMAATGKPVFVTTIYTNTVHFRPDHPEHQKMIDLDEITRKICAPYENVVCVEGREILNRTEYLSADGIHPCDQGHFMMAQNWYDAIRAYLV